MSKKSQHTLAGPSTQDEKKRKAIWNEKLIEEFIDICIGEVEAGNRPGTHFNRLGWANIIKKFNEKTGNQYDYKKFKNKWDNLKANWSIWMKLVGKETGLGWDPVRNTIDAPDAWWEKKLQEIPDAAKFRERGLQHAIKLDRLFRGTSATGEGAWAPALLLQEDVEDTIEVYERLDGVNNDTFEGLGDSDEDHHMIAYKIDDVPTDNFNVNLTLASDAIQERGKKRVSSTLHDKKCKKVGGAAQLSQQLSRLIDAVEKKSTVPSKMIDKPGRSIDEVMDVVHMMPEMVTQPELLLIAAEVLLKREHREMFMALRDTNLRIEWLKRMSNLHK
ncbi:L10-interacting MYB domain-containing protein-like [Phoenix dactylifera]|uniref:L10-interacting MYB domain-containing protein-like n=1 Tax=Phoenix dactylifera TaxID=42345 RepID=A0A8B8ZTG6_PHODC|nr:L10-interacting MYB domain-containing protein-like [Phoenix dactylifera]